MKQIIVDNQVTRYYITEDGKCLNGETNKYLKGQISNSGYLNYNLTLDDGAKKRVYAHRLVASAYLENNNSKATEVNHKDGNKLNNSINNLEWVTPSENQKHAIENRLRAFDLVYCFNKDKTLYKVFKTVPLAAEEIGCSTSLIQQELMKKTEKTLTAGYYWSRDKELGSIKNYINGGVAKVVYQYDLNNNFIQKFRSTGEAGRQLGICSSHIGECCRGKLKQYKGYIWKYEDDIV